MLCSFLSKAEESDVLLFFFFFGTVNTSFNITDQHRITQEGKHLPS
jgi:hypothetical protein